MKLCTLCKTEQPFTNFHKGKRYKDGFRTWCKTCMAAYKKTYVQENKTHILQKQRAYDAVVNPLRKKYFASRYLENKEKMLAANKKYKKENLHLHAIKEARRRIAKINRTPKWLSEEDRWLIAQAYELAALRTKMFNFQWDVDHIIPLQGKKVSGLHVPNNLRVIPAKINRQKNNHYEVVL